MCRSIDGPLVLLQTFSVNMSVKGKPRLEPAKKRDTFTCVTFKPDLAKFGMIILEEQTVSLMRKRVYDLAGVLGKGVKVRHPASPEPAAAVLSCPAYSTLHKQIALCNVCSALDTPWATCIESQQHERCASHHM